VEGGGTLVYLPSGIDFGVGTPEGMPRDQLRAALGLRVGAGTRAGGARPWPAFFVNPPGNEFRVGSPRYLETDGDVWTPLLVAEESRRVVAATRALGDGRVYVASSEALFSNAGLREGDNYAFVLNILARHAGSRSVAFDEAHHHLVRQTDLLDVARTSPAGWAIGLAALATFLFLLWGGRRFGPPLVPRPSPRAEGEYVAAFAGLLQRAHAVPWAQAQYAALFRKRLARELGAGAGLPASLLAARYAERRRTDSEAIERPLLALEGPPLAERALIERVTELEEGMTGWGDDEMRR
jgi:hypothetical protein